MGAVVIILVAFVVFGIGWARIGANPAVPQHDAAMQGVAPDEPEAMPASGEPVASGPSLQEIASVHNGFQRNAALYAYLADRDAEELAGLIREVQRLPPVLHRSDISRVLYLRLASIDPQAALGSVLAGSARPSWLRVGFRHMGQFGSRIRGFPRQGTQPSSQGNRGESDSRVGPLARAAGSHCDDLGYD